MAAVSVQGTPGNLKPVVAGPAADCCQADTKFARCEFTLLLGGISANAPTRSLVFQFYLPLPQTTVTVTNDSAIDQALTTWHGPADIGAMTTNQIRSQVVVLGAYDMLCNLVWNEGFSSNAVVDNTLLWGEMKKRLHTAA